MRLISPSRDIPEGYKAFQHYRVKGEESFHLMEDNGYSPSPCRGHCEDLYGYCDMLDRPVYFPDPFDNEVFFFGFYGADPRQRYYVYLPEVESNGEVVVLIHGGAWFSGPNPDEIIGFPFKYAPDASNQSLVGDLLNEGYTVVSVLYRLAKFGTTHQEIESNLVNGFNALDRILDDIEAAVDHFKDRMYQCYNTTYEDFHILGESAGGHIALMYVYTRADQNLVKSVTSLYAPSNFRQFATYLFTVPSWANFTCNNQFDAANDNYETSCGYNLLPYGTPKHMPFNLLIDPGITTLTQNYFDNNCATNFSSQRVLLSYNLFQSCVGKVVSSPSTSQEFLNYSPALLSGTINIPTFILHGRRDFIVPHNQSRFNMNTRLANSGGLVSQTSVCHNTQMPNMGSNSHLDRLYLNVGHGLRVIAIFPLQFQFQELMFNRVRSDILHWINLH